MFSIDISLTRYLFCYNGGTPSPQTRSKLISLFGIASRLNEIIPADKILLARNKKTFFYSFFFHGTMFIFFFKLGSI